MYSLSNHFPIDMRVNFAGLRGTARDMVAHGWEFELTSFDVYRGEKWYRAYGRHRGMNIYCISAPFFNDGHLVDLEAPIMINHCGGSLILQIQGGREYTTVASNWSGEAFVDRSLFDGSVSYGRPGPFGSGFRLHRLALEEYVRFKSVDPMGDIYVPKEEIWTVEKHLKAIREIQEPKQKEIRSAMLDGKYAGSKNESKLNLILVS